MSIEYNNYLVKHKSNVKKGFEWIREHLPELVLDIPGVDYEWQIISGHDLSKDQPDEYEAYDKYFYSRNRSYQVVQDFRKAWLLHIHRNPHHWQYWVLINDDPAEGEVVLDMPYNYILEMICDWWAFSWGVGNLYEIFAWYEGHEKYMKLSKKTRMTVVDILGVIKSKLDSMESGE